MQIEESDEQLENAESPRKESGDPDANATVPTEEPSSQRSTEHGPMQSSESDEQSEKAFFSMRRSLEPAPNTAVARR
jgi:hypothetical protein